MEQEEKIVSKKNKYRKPKPWDDESIDHWKPVKMEENERAEILVESSFGTLFPKYRESYINGVWFEVEVFLRERGVRAELDLRKGSMMVFSTPAMRDPYALIAARDVIKLLARSVPFASAKRVFEDGIACEVIKINGLVRNKEKFVKRRQRLIGPD